MENNIDPQYQPPQNFQQPEYRCTRCYVIVVSGAHFCTNCGMKLKEKEEVLQHREVGEQPMLWPLMQYGLLLLFCLVVRIGEFGFAPINSIIIDVIMAVIIMAFALRELPSLKDVLVWKNFSLVTLIVVIGGAVVGAFAVDLLAGALESMYDEDYQLYYFQNSPFPVLLSIISVAFFPALFEEIAFRGVLYTQLNRVLSTTATIIVTAIAFSILHLNPVGFIWLLPIGLVTAWLRYKTGVIWYGIILHFVYNTGCVLFYFY